MGASSSSVSKASSPCLFSKKSIGGRSFEDDPTTVQAHDNDIDEKWLAELLSCLTSIAVEGPLSQCLKFLDVDSVIELEELWVKKKMKLQKLKNFPVMGFKRLQNIQLPPWSEELAGHYEVIYSYTCQSPNLFGRVSHRMNDAERRTRTDGDAVEVSQYLRDVMLPWVRRLQLALGSLPAVFNVECDLYRGMKHRFASGHFSPGAVVALYTFKSFTVDSSLMEDDVFCGQSNSRTIFIIRQGRGKFIAPLSEFRDELEVVLLPGTKLQVEKVTNQSMKRGSPFQYADIVEFSMI